MGLEETTKRLGEWHDAWKASEKEKNKCREKFLQEVNEVLHDELPARSVERIEAIDEEEVLRISQRRFQRYEVLEVRDLGKGQWDVVLEENPEYKPYTYINKIDGKVYKKVITEGTPYLDDASLRDEDHELWERISVERTERVLKPLEELPAEDLAKIQPYLTSPRPQVRLANPREAKEEELNEDDDRRS